MKLNGYGNNDYMGGCEYVGLFLDFSIYKITESKENMVTSITYIANEITGNYRYISEHLDELILKVVKHEYKNNSFYTEFLNNFIDELKKRG